ncbi:hypothetical protein ABEF93_006582 [Exophiala dermatitidis]
MSTLKGRSRQGDPMAANKLVEINYEAKEAARALNGGTLPYSPALVTSDFPHKYEWSKENLPAVLFYLVPPPSPHSDKPIVMLFENGKPVLNAEGAQLRDFEVLPRQISVDVEGWLIETWRRLDPRIKFSDILDRMTADPTYGGGIGLVKPSSNILQNHCRRNCRKLLKTSMERSSRDEPHRTEVEALESLTSENLTYNTVLDVCELFPDRLVKVKLAQDTPNGQLRAEKYKVTAENWKHTTLAKDYFLKAVALRGYQAMDDTRLAAWEMLLLLQERADKHGLVHWSKLPKTCLPVSWFDRTRNKTLPNDTFDGGCNVCTWRPSVGGDDQKTATDFRKEKPAVMKVLAKRRATDTEDTNGERAAKRIKTELPAYETPHGKQVIHDPSLFYQTPQFVQQPIHDPSLLYLTPQSRQHRGAFEEPVWLCHGHPPQQPVFEFNFTPVPAPATPTPVNHYTIGDTQSDLCAVNDPEQLALEFTFSPAPVTPPTPTPVNHYTLADTQSDLCAVNNPQQPAFEFNFRPAPAMPPTPTPTPDNQYTDADTARVDLRAVDKSVSGNGNLLYQVDDGLNLDQSIYPLW